MNIQNIENRRKRYLLTWICMFAICCCYGQVNRLMAGQTSVIQGQTIVLPLILENESPIAGGQFEVLLPTGLTVENVTLNQLRANGHKLTYRYNPESGKLFVLFYASPNTPLRGNDGTLVEISLNIPTDYPINTYTIKFGEEIKLAVDALTPAPLTSSIAGSLTVNDWHIPVTSIRIYTPDDVTTLTPDFPVVHLQAEVQPESATDRTVTWSLIEGENLVLLSPDGTLSAEDCIHDGIVKVRATANDGFGQHDELTLTLSGFAVKVTSINVTTEEGRTYVNKALPQLHLKAKIFPENAEISTVTWSLQTEQKGVTLDANGLLTMTDTNAKGIIIIRATANDSSGVYGEIAISLEDVRIGGIEYFYGKDPGYGNGIWINATEGDILSFIADIEELHDGCHLLNVRAMDTSGIWSQTVSYPFLKVAVPPGFASSEYFFDTDPGYGKGTEIPNSTFVADISGLTDGFHTLNIRTQDTNGSWSHTSAIPFAKLESSVISRVEYYIDTDPGKGKAIAAKIPERSNRMELSFTINMSSYREGEHTLYIRACNESGYWGLVESAPFKLTPSGVGISDITWLMPIILNPSPADTYCEIQLPKDNAEYEVYITSASGKLLFQMRERTTGHTIKFNTASLPDDIYLIIVKDVSDGYSATKRLIIHHK